MKKGLVIALIIVGVLLVIGLAYYFLIYKKEQSSKEGTEGTNGVGGEGETQDTKSKIQQKIQEVISPTSTTSYIGAGGSSASTPQDTIAYFKATYSGDVLKNRILTEAKYILDLKSDHSTISDYTFSGI